MGEGAFSLIGRRQIINILACHYLKLFTKLIFRYLWNFSKLQPISQSVLYHSLGEVGLGVINIKCKIDALHIQHVRQLINGHDAKWTTFATYWTGIQLRHYNADLGRNDIPHSEQIPTFYKKILNLIKPGADIHTMKTKQIYEEQDCK